MDVGNILKNIRYPEHKYYEDRALFMYVTTLVLSLVALMANGFVLYLAKRLQVKWGSFSDQLITYIALTDLLNSVTMFVGFVGAQILGFPGTFQSEWYCRSVGLLLTQFPCYSIIMISFLACERYYVIRYRKPFDVFVNKAWVVMYVFFAFLSIPSLLNAYKNGYSPDPTFSYCWPNDNDGDYWAAIQNMILSIIFLEPLAVLVFCYVQIACICMKPIPINEREHARSTRLSPRGAKNSLVFIFFYLLCFGPKVVTTLFFVTGNKDHHPSFMYMIDPLAIQFVVCINPVLLMFLSKKFRDEALKILKLAY